MKRILLLILCVITFRSFGLPINPNLKLVKIIGDEETDFIFSFISDAILTPNKVIIILDAKGNFIARFDWDGNFVNRIGQQGKGPGDFWWPASVDILGDKLYYLDRFNNRLAESDLELKNLHYFKLPPNFILPPSFGVIDEDKFIVNNASLSQPAGPKVCIIEKASKTDTKVNRMFFKHTPIDTRPIEKNKDALRKLLRLFSTVYAVDADRKRVLVTFQSPDNSIAFYLYGVNGKLLKTFCYQMDEKYHFPHHLYKEKRLTLASLLGRYSANVGGIFYYNGHWYVFVSQHHYKRGDYELTAANIQEYSEAKSFYLKFDEAGEWVGRFDLDDSFRCYYISPDGYVLGIHPRSEVMQLMIYKMLKQ